MASWRLPFEPFQEPVHVTPCPRRRKIQPRACRNVRAHHENARPCVEHPQKLQQCAGGNEAADGIRRIRALSLGLSAPCARAGDTHDRARQPVRMDAPLSQRDRSGRHGRRNECDQRGRVREDGEPGGGDRDAVRARILQPRQRQRRDVRGIEKTLFGAPDHRPYTAHSLLPDLGLHHQRVSHRTRAPLHAEDETGGLRSGLKYPFALMYRRAGIAIGSDRRPPFMLRYLSTNGLGGFLRPLPSYSTRAPDALTTRAHFSSSDLRWAANCSGVPAITSEPRAVKSALPADACSARAISACRRLTLAGGVPAGASTPYQALTTTPATPPSAIVGTCGAEADRCVSAIASARTLPAFAYGNVISMSLNMSESCPPIKSVSASIPPL